MIQESVLGQAKAPRIKDRKRVSIKEIQAYLRSSIPRVLAQTKTRFFKLFGYIKAAQGFELAEQLSDISSFITKQEIDLAQIQTLLTTATSVSSAADRALKILPKKIRRLQERVQTMQAALCPAVPRPEDPTLPLSSLLSPERVSIVSIAEKATAPISVFVLRNIARLL